MKKILLVLILGCTYSSFSQTARTSPLKQHVVVFKERTSDQNIVYLVNAGQMGTNFTGGFGLGSVYYDEYSCSTSNDILVYGLQPNFSNSNVTFLETTGSLSGNVDVGSDQSNNMNYLPGTQLTFAASGLSGNYTITLPVGSYSFTEKVRRFASSGNMYGYTYTFIFSPSTHYYCDNASTSPLSTTSVGAVTVHVRNRSDWAWNTGYHNNSSTFEICKPASNTIDLKEYVNYPYGYFWLLNGTDTLHSAISVDSELDFTQVQTGVTYTLAYVQPQGYMFSNSLAAFENYAFNEHAYVKKTISNYLKTQTKSQLLNSKNYAILEQPIRFITPSLTYFDLPDQLCAGEILDLYDYVDISSGGNFSGNGVNAANRTLSYNTPGNYTINVNYTDNKGCYYEFTDTIEFGASLSINKVADGEICIGDSYQLGASGGLSYSWSPTTGLSNPNIANPVASPTSTTTYTVSVTGNDGDCPGQATVKVTVNPLPVVTVSSTAVICEGQSTQLTASGATSYVWSPSTGLSNPNIANPVASPTTTTTYSVIGTDANGCESVEKTVLVTVKEKPSGSVAQSEIAICTGQSAQLQASGGVSYSWTGSNLTNNSIANPIATPTSTTVYTVTITGSNGCTDTKQVIVTVNGLPTANAGNNTQICVGGSVALSGSGAGIGGTYSWSPTIGLNNPNVQNPTASPTSTTDYVLTVTNANGCTDTDDVRVTVVTPAALTISADNVVQTSVDLCKGQSSVLRALMSGAVSYSWTPITNISNPIIQNPTITPTQNTTYSVTVTDGNGCERTESISVVVNDLPAGDVSFASVDICKDESVQLQAFGGTTYSWTGSNLSNPNIANPVVTPISTSVYEVTIGNEAGCTVKKSVIVTVNNNPVAAAGSDVQICNGGSVQLAGSGAGTGGTYEWSPSTGLSNFTSQNPVASPTSTTVYTLTATNNKGCSSTDQVIVTVNNPASVVTTVGGQVSSSVEICKGSSAQLGSSMTNAVSYSWSPVTGLNNPNVAGPVASPTVTTNYQVTITDNKGCQNTGSVSVVVNDLPQGSVTFSEAAICSGESIQLIASGGTTYAWTGNNLTNPNISNPIASPTNTTVYEVTIGDAKGCTVKKQVVVTVNANPVAAAGSDVQICNGGSIQLSGSGAGTGGTYEWSPSTGLSNFTVQNPTASPTSTTVYTLTATNNKGCSSTDQVIVTVNNPANVVTTVGGQVSSSVEICKGTSAQLGSSMTNAVSYAWSPVTGLNNPNVAAPIASPTTSTTYQVTITDNKGCQNTGSVAVTVNDLPQGSVSFSEAAICAGGSIQLVASGGTSYAWTGNNLSNASVANPTASPTSTTVYEVTISDTKGCSVKKQVIVTVHSNPIAGAGTDVEICEGGNTTLFGSGAGVNGTYAWSPSTGLDNPNLQNPKASPTSTTTYTLTVTNENGCVSTDQVKVTVNKPGNVVTTVNGGVGSSASICVGSSVTLGASMTSAVSYEWSPSTGLNNPYVSGPIASPTTNTTYTVLITDSKGCSKTSTIAVTVNPLPTGDVTFSSASICLGESLQLGATGGNSYAWTGNNITGASGATPTVQPTTTSTYSVDIFNSNGCKVTKTVTVTVNPLPNAAVGTNKEICIGSSVQISASGAGSGGSYSWSPQESLSDPFVSNPTASPSQTTTYTVTVTNANGCENSKQVTVTVNNPGSVLTYADDNLTSEYDVCIGSTVTLKGTMTGAVSYSWSPTTGLNNSTVQSPIATVTTNRTYTVTIVDNKGCQKSASIVINALQNPVLDFSAPIALCKDDDPIDLRNYVNLNNVTFSGNGVSGVMFNPASVSTGVTFVTGTFSSGECNTTDQFEINVLAATNAVASADAQICIGGSAQLSASGGSSYSWSPSLGLSNISISNPVANPTQTTLYTVSVTAANGCVDTEDVLVTVLGSATGSLTTDKDTYEFGELVSFGFNQTSALTISSYAWNLGNGVSSTSAAPKFYYYESGQFPITLTVTTSSGCSSQFTKTITVKQGDGIVTGIDDRPIKERVYPIPFSTHFTVESVGNESQYQLSDLSGRMVMSGELRQGKNEIQTSTLSEGMYLLLIRTGSDLQTLKMFKQ